MKAKVISIVQDRSFSIVQLSSSEKNSFKYISGNKAFRLNEVKISEMNDYGSVNDVIIINNSDDYIFFMDGDIIIGAKQNRVLNTSLLLAPKSKNQIPVSCIEKGRWSDSISDFDLTPDIIPHELRTRKNSSLKENLEKVNRYYADQDEVWGSVDGYAMMYEKDSFTNDLTEIIGEIDMKAKEFADFFKVSPDANMAMFFIGEELVSIDHFNSVEIYTEYFSKITKSIMIDYMDTYERYDNVSNEIIYTKSQKIIDEMEGMKKNVYKAAGLGIEERFENEEISGFKLNYKNKLIHLAAFRKSQLNDERRNEYDTF